MEAGIYKHYKGGYYQVLGVAAHSETGEEMIVYISLDPSLPGSRMRVRPRTGVAGFETPVSIRTKLLDNIPVERMDLKPRFQYIGDSLDGAKEETAEDIVSKMAAAVPSNTPNRKQKR
jgi:hypothetical protein